MSILLAFIFGFLLLIPIFLFSYIMTLFGEKRRLEYLKQRQDHEKLWRLVFSKENFGNVERMLMDVCNSFSIPGEYRFRLRPSDKISELYESCTKDGFDGYEYETFFECLQKDFNFSQEECYVVHTLTIGDLVGKITKPLHSV